MRDLFATMPDDPAPPTPAGYLDTVLARGRRSVRRRRVGAAAAWAAVLLAVAVLVVPGGSRPATPDGPGPATPGAPLHRPGLPDRLAGYSSLTSTVSKSPPGRAIALYGYGNGELFDMFQSLVVGADSNAYRILDAMQERGRPSALLAPDGTAVLLGDDRGATGDLLLVDLSTGRRRSIPLGGPVGVRLLAWSADGRYVAYSAAPLPAPDGNGDFVEHAVARTGTLRLLDLSTGRSSEVPAAKPAWTAAFAPDGRRLAVQIGQEAHLLDLEGRESGRVSIPAGRELAANVGWSPDGRFLATVPWAAEDGPAGGSTSHDTFLWRADDLGFVPVGGGSPPAPVGNIVRLLGWRSAGTVVVAATNGSGQLSLVEVPLDGGGRRTLTRFDTGRTCELGLQHCQVFDLQLATGLLPEVTVRHAGRPQRGPWPVALTAGVAVAGAGVALLLWRVTRAARRRRASG
jgi:hypothetical protein